MSGFLDILVQVLSIPLHVGPITLNLGAVALGALILRLGRDFFFSLLDTTDTGEALYDASVDQYLDDAWYEERYGATPEQDGHS